MKSTVTLRWPRFFWRWGRHKPGVDPDVSTVEKGRNLDPDKRYSVQKQKDVEKQNSVFLAVSRVEGVIYSDKQYKLKVVF